MSYWLRDPGLYPANAPNASRREPSDPPGDWPEVRLPPAGERERLPIPTDPTRLSHSSVGPCAQPWTAWWHLQDLAAAWRTCPQAVWPPASAQVWLPDTRPATVPADQFSCGHPSAAHRPTDMAEPPTVRSAGRPSPMWPPGRWARTRPACKRPEADTSSAERPTMRLAS